MTSVFILRDILELIQNALDDPAFAQHDLIKHRQEPFFHVLFELGDELHSNFPAPLK